VETVLVELLKMLTSEFVKNVTQLVNNVMVQALIVAPLVKMDHF